MEIGGDDQWSNILAGIELIRRIDAKEGIGLTTPLITKSDGKKMGKSESGSVWLKPEWTTPYEYFQYWRNSTDEDVLKFMKLYTFLPLEEISRFESCEGVELNEAKELLAYEATKLMHGEEEAEKARNTAKNIFLKGGNEGAPSVELQRNQVLDQLIIDVAVSAKIFESKGEARRMIKQGGLSINNEKINDINAIITNNDIDNNEIMVKKGKKTFTLIKIK